MPSHDRDFTPRLDALDLSLFAGIESQSTDADRRGWLLVQRAVRRASGYVYLEVGSHLGGSIQQHIVDPWCRAIISIDKRPQSQPDDRGRTAHYQGNATDRMLDNLRSVAPDSPSKLRCFDADASQVDPATIVERADFCFIDAEHTHAAVLSDFQACLRLCTPDAAIGFHDAFVVHRAIAAILEGLRKDGVSFDARKLGGSTFAIFLRNCPARTDARVRAASRDGASWLRARRLRDRVPQPLIPAARWVKRRLAGLSLV
jgi:hypothetical protein